MINTKQLDKLGSNTRKLANIVRFNSSLANEAAEEMTETMKSIAPARTGTLRRGITYKLRPSAGQIVIRSKAMRGSFNYAYTVEYGWTARHKGHIPGQFYMRRGYRKSRAKVQKILKRGGMRIIRRNWNAH